MADVSGPLIIRHTQPTHFVKPGLHSHNAKRRAKPANSGNAFLRHIRALLLLIGLCGLGYYGYTLSDEYIYQAYQNWAFDQQIGGRRQVTFADYIRERTPFGFLVGTTAAEPKTATGVRPALPVEMPHPVQGALLGRVEISRLKLSAMVREGVDAKTLSIAVGHVPSTALPGQVGNFAIAAHRDTLFRALQNIRDGDEVTFQSPEGTYTYQVIGTAIVRPSDVSVLRPDGGGVIVPANGQAAEKTPEKLLTMITCYPFYYVGSAPQRFIVEARLMSADAGTKLSPTEAQNAGPPAGPPPIKRRQALKPKVLRQASLNEPRSRRGSSRIGRPHSGENYQTQAATNNTPKKRGLWHKLLHVS